MNQGRPQQLMGIGNRAVAVLRFQTRGTRNGGGGKIPRPIQGQQITALIKDQRLERFAALQLPKDPAKHRPQGVGGHGIQPLSHIGVARDALDAIEGLPIALRALPIKVEQRGAFEREQGEARHEGIGQGHPGLSPAGIRKGGKQAADDAEQCIGREMFPCFRCSDAHPASFKLLTTMGSRLAVTGAV